MTRLFLLAAAALPLGACEMAPPPMSAQQMAYEQQQLSALIGPRTAMAPQNCMMSTPSMDVRVVGNTIVARSAGRIWVNRVEGNCREAANGGASLVMEPTAGGLHCNNSTVRVVASGGVTVGSCTLGNWTPYN